MNSSQLLRSYLATAPASLNDVRTPLWNSEITILSYPGGAEKYQLAVLEQYKIYVEMADRISARRALTNTFFLTLNTAIFTLVGVFWNNRPQVSPWLLLFPLAGLLVQTGAWFWLLRSYRQLNTAKYVVIGAIEERLPASPYWAAEWKALGEGKDSRKYWPLTHLEQWVPIAFATVYVVAFVVSVAV